MNLKVLQGYMALCRQYGWPPTWEGLRAFARGDRARCLAAAISHKDPVDIKNPQVGSV